MQVFFSNIGNKFSFSLLAIFISLFALIMIQYIALTHKNSLEISKPEQINTEQVIQNQQIGWAQEQ